MPGLRKKIFTVIYGTHTPAGKGFDVVLLWFILISVLTVSLESVPSLKREYQYWFYRLEWFFTIAFTIEYLLRIYSHPRPLKYIFSFYGVIDLIAILPTYLALLIGGVQYLVTIRALRLLRIFRILKLTSFIHHAQTIRTAMLASYQKIMVFMLTVLSIVLIIGTMMYVIEGEEGGFTSIPVSIYWCIVTITTVGYGDITPLTPIGKMLSSVVMLIGYSIIAVPTGIVTVELTRSMADTLNPGPGNLCHNCGETMPESANYCMHCGSKMEKPKTAT